MELTDKEIGVLKDMLDEWGEKDRHGLLGSEWNYDDDQIDAVSSLSRKVRDEAKGRKLWWAR